MVGHDVDDDLDVARMSRSDHVIEVIKRARRGSTSQRESAHIIAAIDKRRWVKRAQPDSLDAQLLKIVHLLGNARDIAQTRTSRILKRARVDLIDRASDIHEREEDFSVAMGRISLATRLCEMPTMIRPKRTFAANNATATPQTLAPSRVRVSWDESIDQ